MEERRIGGSLHLKDSERYEKLEEFSRPFIN